MTLEGIRLSGLFALARGLELRPGPHRCFFCGAACDESEPASRWVKRTCTVRQYVAAPGSEFVCRGCAASMNERAEVPVADEPQPRYGKRVRCFSWVITAAKARAFTHAHIPQLAALCCEPPEPPFGLVLAVSGQRHLIYRGAVNLQRDLVTVSLEEEQITYAPRLLRDRLRLAESLAACAGKPSLSRPPSMGLFARCLEYYGETGPADAWSAVWAEPISRLAAWLSRPKEKCRDEH